MNPVSWYSQHWVLAITNIMKTVDSQVPCSHLAVLRDVISVIILQKSVTFIPHWLTLSVAFLACILWWGCHVGEAHMARDWEWTNSQPGTRALNLTANKELNPGTNNMSHLESEPISGWALRWTPVSADNFDHNFVKDPERRTQLSCDWFPIHRNCEMINACCLNH